MAINLYDKAPKFALSYPDETLKKFLIRNGFVFTTVEKADHIFFGGGADINPFLYGEKRHPRTSINLNRDLSEVSLIRSLPYRKSKIGVCRGGQLLNVVLGNGRMYQHVDNHTKHHLMFDMIDKDKPGTHTVMVTSVHHQMMIPGDGGIVLFAAREAYNKESANGRMVYGKSERESITDDAEVIYYSGENALCWQPHPEYEHSPESPHAKLFIDTIETYFLNKTEADARRALVSKLKQEKAL